MFEGIDQIDWKNLSHAYGEAVDVPHILRDLTSDEAQKREEAIHALHSNIWHQGTVYEATAYAVPFLVEFASTTGLPCRSQILALLTVIACGTSYHDVHQHLSLFEVERAKPEWRAQIEIELVWVKAARDAVLRGLPHYVDLLADEDCAVRAAAAYVLAALPESTDRVRSALVRRAEIEHDSIACASMLLAIAHLFSKDAGTPKELGRYLSNDREPVVRLAAAMGLVVCEGATMAPEAIDLLLGATEGDSKLDKQWQAMPWAQDEVSGAASEYLRLAGSRVADVVLPRLSDALNRDNPFTALSIAESMLFFAFEGKAVHEGTAFSSLSDRQQSVLQTIAISDKAWSINANMAEVLRGYRLPDWPDRLQDYCGLQRRHVGIDNVLPKRSFWSRLKSFFGYGA